MIFFAFAVAPSLLLLAAALVRAMTNEGAGDRATYISRSGNAADFMSDWNQHGTSGFAQGVEEPRRAPHEPDRPARGLA